MAAAYEEDESIAPEHAAGEMGKTVSWTGRFADATLAILAGPFQALGNASNGFLSSFIPEAVIKANEAVGAMDSLADAPFGGVIPGITSVTPLLAGVVAIGEGLQVADDLASGNMKKAGKHLITGSAKVGVVFLDGLTMGLAELPSLLFTGKMLSTNVGNFVGQMLDGADKQTQKTANLAAVGFPGSPMAYAAPPPAAPQAVAPYGMQPPPGGWAKYEMARRGQPAAAQGQSSAAPVVSGNPRFADAVEVARAAAGAQPLPAQNPT